MQASCLVEYWVILAPDIIDSRAFIRYLLHIIFGARKEA